ncbi:MAG: right-handed parallel beta-helix repeat-containing protein [Deinococcales bacterium]
MNIIILKDNNASGISYLNDSMGEAINNIIEENKRNGISIRDNAQVKIERNTIRNNFQSGISYVFYSKGEVIENFIEFNEEYGIEVRLQGLSEVNLYRNPF